MSKGKVVLASKMLELVAIDEVLGADAGAW